MAEMMMVHDPNVWEMCGWYYGFVRSMEWPTALILASGIGHLERVCKLLKEDEVEAWCKN
jgi:hypothetical protein